MFTFIENYKKLFMMSVMSYQQQPDMVSQALDDKKIDHADIA